MAKSETPNLPDLIEAESRILTERLRGARAALPMHEYEKGAALERVAHDFLRAFLPREYGLGTGFVAWREPNASSAGRRYHLRTSGQLDIIIYDALRAGPIADLGTAQVYPIEGVFGYVEVKATFRDSIESVLKQAKGLRDPEHRFYIGQHTEWMGVPGVEATNPEVIEYVDDPDGEQPHEWNRARRIHLRAESYPQLRPLPFVFAFEYEREPPEGGRTDEGIVDHFREKWRAVGHLSHLYGVLLGEHGFLRCIPNHAQPDRFEAEVAATSGAAAFKRWMMIELSRRFRMPEGWSIDYEGYWSEAER